MRKSNINKDFLKESFAIALIELMRNHDYHSISITDICKKAGFGRTSYYKYFDNNKENLIFFISHMKWQECKEKHPENKDEGKLLLEHIYRYKGFFLLLRRQGLDHLIVKILFNEFGIQKDEPEVFRYGKAFFTGAYFGVIYEWINQGCLDTPEEISKKFEEGLKLAVISQKAKAQNSEETKKEDAEASSF